MQTTTFRPMAPPDSIARLSDWHPADIVAALSKRGTSLRRLSAERGYSAGTLRKALRYPWPKAEAVIAEALGVHPAVLWPSRYGADGGSNRSKVRWALSNVRKDTATAGGCKVNAADACPAVETPDV